LVRLIIVEDEPLLPGSGANLGRVRRRGQIVIRPAGPHSATVQAFLTHLAMVGFGGSPRPVGQSESDEMLEYIPGDVPVPPQPPHDGWLVSLCTKPCKGTLQPVAKTGGPVGDESRLANPMMGS
jgi:hypothetical protein